MTWMDMVWAAAGKATIGLAVAFAAGWWLRARSAAVRHYVWTIALAAALAIPVLPRFEPRAVALPASVITVVAAGATHAPVAAGRPWLAWFWWLGCAAVCGRFLAGAVQVARLAGRAKPAAYATPILSDAGAKVRVLESGAIAVPLAWGLFRPVILLPAGAGEWPATRLESVLRHELAHIARRDVLTQALAQAACAFYWFHPLMWIAARRQRLERERAADDAVLAAGVAAEQYAGDLLELARAWSVRRRAHAAAPAMAAASELETRVRSLVETRNRNPLTLRAAIGIGAAACVLLAPMTGVAVYAQGGGSLSGTVEDSSGARVPNCAITARNQDGSNVEAGRSDAAGVYRFGALPPGHYSLEFAAPGFARLALPANVEAGKPARLDARLDLGQATEHLTVTGQKPAATVPAAQPAGKPVRIRVGGMVQPMRLLEKTNPVYPPELEQQGVEGTVLIRAVISRDGVPVNPAVLNTDVDPRLAQAALESVRQWRYQPSRLNGETVETATTITVEFRLGK
jgi:TonB family protein